MGFSVTYLYDISSRFPYPIDLLLYRVVYG